jgi:exosome complex RNA-binding protein Rrp4
MVDVYGVVKIRSEEMKMLSPEQIVEVEERHDKATNYFDYDDLVAAVKDIPSLVHTLKTANAKIKDLEGIMIKVAPVFRSELERLTVERDSTEQMLLKESLRADDAEAKCREYEKAILENSISCTTCIGEGCEGCLHFTNESEQLLWRPK